MNANKATVIMDMEISVGDTGYRFIFPGRYGVVFLMCKRIGPKTVARPFSLF